MKMKFRILWSVVIATSFALYVNGLAYIVYVYKKDSVEQIEKEINYINMLKPSDAESVMAIITAEGFDHAFNHYSTYKDINDTKFHDLRKAYIAASKELMDYIAESAGKVSNTPYYLSHESSN